MLERVELPVCGPVLLDEDSRSRRPMIVFGDRGPVVRGGRWTAEELAVQTERGSGRALRFIAVVIPFREDMSEREQALAFSTLLTWCTPAGATGAMAVCVPRWGEFEPETQAMILLAARSSLRGSWGDATLGDWVVMPSELPLKVLYPHAKHAGELVEVTKPRQPVDRSVVAARLSGAAVSEPTFMSTFTSVLGVGGVPVRDLQAAHTVVEELLTSGWSKADIARYLETFGFRNSRGRTGRWPAARLAEVIAAVKS
ncbi:MAG: hypothetical protein ACOH2F_03800 [Cellulomonas sp.]